MKAKKQIDPFSGLMKVMKVIASGNNDELRKDAFTDKFNNITIDTCIAFDTETWETGINKKDKWVIVEQYDDKDDAIKGHKKWIKLLKKHPKEKLIDINVWGG